MAGHSTAEQLYSTQQTDEAIHSLLERHRVYNQSTCESIHKSQYSAVHHSLMIIYFIYVCQTFIVLFLLTYFCLFNLAHFQRCTLSHTNRLIADLPSSYTSWSQTMIADFPSQDQPIFPANDL